MDYGKFLNFILGDLLFSVVIVVLTFVVGWMLYNFVILKGISLKDSLFEKDNLAAWVEFIGAFIFPTLFLSAKAIEGSKAESIMFDLALCVGGSLIYIIIFTILRLFSGLFVRLINAEDSSGKIILNNEIYVQKNTAAALFSVSVSYFFLSLVSQFQVFPQFDVSTSLYKMANVLIFTLVAFLVYTVILRRKTTLLKEIFVDNNIAAGVDLLGFIGAVGLILNNAVTYNEEFILLEVSLLSVACLIVFGLISFLLRKVFAWIIKVNLWDEVYEQNNIGAAIGQIAIYIGIANIIVYYMK